MHMIYYMSTSNNTRTMREYTVIGIMLGAIAVFVCLSFIIDHNIGVMVDEMRLTNVYLGAQLDTLRDIRTTSSDASDALYCQNYPDDSTCNY